MSSTETSGAFAEATATTQPAGVPAAATTFGTSRGSGLARGKRPIVSHTPPAAAAAPVEYTPTAIEIINAPREYKNPFAPASTEPVPSADHPTAAVPEAAPVAPAPVALAPAPAPVERAHVSPVPAGDMFPLDEATPAAADDKAELNILPPEQQKVVAHQTWESDGFRPEPAPARERDSRDGPPRRDDRREGERRNEQPVPSKFRYERAKDGPLPPRPPPAGTAAAPVTVKTPPKSGGFFSWLKSLFAGQPEEKPAEARNGDVRPEGREGQRHHRHRGGRDRGGFRGQGGGQAQAGGEGRGQGNDYGERRDGGYRRRRRGGRGRGGFEGERRSGGPSAT